ncbi:MAG: ABC transporter ATP-binding protein [Elusimicrobiales bacterium]|nr:ABC transporter ATP-binding protein [Elusimicrobiales bacterium]
MNRLSKELLKYLKPYKIRFIQAALSMIFLAILKGGIVYSLKPIVDRVFVSKDIKMLQLLVLALPIAFALKMIFQYINGYLMSWIGQKSIQQIRYNLFEHIHNLSAEFYWRKRSSDVMARVINDLNNVQSTIQFTPLYIIRDTMTLISLLFVLFYIHWRFALISMIILPLAGILLGILGKKMRKAGKASQVIIGEIAHKFQESLQGILVVKAFNYEEHSITKFKETNDAYFSQMMRYLRATIISGPLMEFLGSMIFLIMIYLGGKEIFSGKMTPGTFFAFMGAFFTIYVPLKNIAKLNSQWQLGMASWERILQILDEKPAVTMIANPKKLEKIEGGIEFENVNYRYPSRQDYVFKNLSFKINPGEMVAFVGPSGSGKSTIINLMLRFFDPNAGKILFEGHNLTELDIKNLRYNIGLVTQDTILFDDTVEKNISIGKPNASKKEIVEATKAADAHSFINSLPQGYDTILGERGIKLSGGQKQRLAIARAILKNPKIILFDEATSNLDTASEKVVQHAIENTLKERTIIMVAHRLSTVKEADKIIVLKDASIAEMGNHKELISKGGLYKKLYDNQN